MSRRHQRIVCLRRERREFPQPGDRVKVMGGTLNAGSSGNYLGGKLIELNSGAITDRIPLERYIVTKLATKEDEEKAKDKAAKHLLKRKKISNPAGTFPRGQRGPNSQMPTSPYGRNRTEELQREQEAEYQRKLEEERVLRRQEKKRRKEEQRRREEANIIARKGARRRVNSFWNP